MGLRSCWQAIVLADDSLTLLSQSDSLKKTGLPDIVPLSVAWYIRAFHTLRFSISAYVSAKLYLVPMVQVRLGESSSVCAERLRLNSHASVVLIICSGVVTDSRV